MNNPNHPGELSVDKDICARNRPPEELSTRLRALDVLNDAHVPFLVGGAYAFSAYTGIYRDTKDLDLFLEKKAALKALEVFEKDGWRTERLDDVWIYKAFRGDYFVDLIFSSGNGVAKVDEEWFAHARAGDAMDRSVWLTPAEEMIWSKAFVLERERYDGADVAHLIHGVGEDLDWNRLMRRFQPHWEVLLAHVMFYRFAYPSERSLIPDRVLHQMMANVRQSMNEGDWTDRVCRGTLMSKANYTIDVGEWGFADGRDWNEDRQERARAGKGAYEGLKLEVAGGGGR